MPVFRCLPLLALLAAGCTPERAVLPARPAPPHLNHLPKTLAVPELAAAPTEPQPEPKLLEYLHLTAEQCRSSACQHAPGADSILAAARDDDAGYLCDTSAKAETAQVRRVLARRLSQDVRNRSAGAALDLYYRLLEAELVGELLTAALTDLDELVRTTEAARDRGFTVAAELARIRKQQGDTRLELIRVRAGARKLNGELKYLIGLTHEPGTLLPTDRITVVRDRLDPDAAVKVGLAHRADIVGLRELDAQLGPKTVGAVRGAMVALTPGAGAVAAAGYRRPIGVAHFLPHLLAQDVADYRRFLHDTLARREAEADKDIRSAVDEWAAQQDLVAVAKERAVAERQRLAELTGQRQGGAAVEREYHTARLEALKADGDAIREAIKWKRADVATRQAMGLLCGEGEAPGCQ